MSGHSKFANIKHKKEKNDAAKAKVFTRISKEIAMAVKEGGSGDPNTNSKLREAVAKAKANNIPNDNIDRTIKKALVGPNMLTMVIPATISAHITAHRTVPRFPPTKSSRIGVMVPPMSR